MPYQYMADSHVHSDNSPDGYDSVSYLCERASLLGLDVLTITDHCECNFYERDAYSRSIRQSIFEVRKAQIVFKNDIKLLLGLELGQPLQNIDAAREALSFAPYDFVIGSLHNISGLPDFAFINYDEHEIPELLDRYYDELYEIVCKIPFSVLGHLTYPLRYIEGVYGARPDMGRLSRQIDRILKEIIYSGRGIEINVSGLRQPIGKALPDLKYVRRYRELGGEIITIGSDAHRAQDLASHLEDGIRIAQEAGFTKIAYFEKGKPEFLPILELD